MKKPGIYYNETEENRLLLPILHLQMAHNQLKQIFENPGIATGMLSNMLEGTMYDLAPLVGQTANLNMDTQIRYYFSVGLDVANVAKCVVQKVGRGYSNVTRKTIYEWVVARQSRGAESIDIFLPPDLTDRKDQFQDVYHQRREFLDAVIFRNTQKKITNWC